MAPRPSADFRERLVAACDAGLPPGEAARLFRVDVSTVYRWRRRARRGESLAEKPRSGRPPNWTRRTIPRCAPWCWRSLMRRCRNMRRGWQPPPAFASVPPT